MALAAPSRSGESTGYLSRSAKRSAIFLLYAAHFCSAASLIWSGSISLDKLAPLRIYYMGRVILGTARAKIVQLICDLTPGESQGRRDSRTQDCPKIEFDAFRPTEVALGGSRIVQDAPQRTTAYGRYQT